MSVLVPVGTRQYIDVNNRVVTVLSYTLPFPSGDIVLDRSKLQKDLLDTLNSLVGLAVPKAIVKTTNYPQTLKFDIEYVDWSVSTLTERLKTTLDWQLGLWESVKDVYLKPAGEFAVEVATDLKNTASNIFTFGIPAIAVLAVIYLFVRR